MIQPRYATFDGEASPHIDLGSVSKFNWKSGEFRDHFSEAFGTIESNHDEWLMAQVADNEHPRKVATAEPDNWEDLVIAAGKKGLTFDHSEDKSIAIVAENQAQIDTWLNGDDQTKAKLEGVPRCCVSEIGNREEPIYEAACASESAREISDNGEDVIVPNSKSTLNTLWEYRDISLLDYIPCSFECDASHELAIKNGELLRDIGLDEEAELLWEWLNTPTTWEAYHGLTHLRNEYGIGEYNVGNNWRKKTVQFGGNHLKIGGL